MKLEKLIKTSLIGGALLSSSLSLGEEVELPYTIKAISAGAYADTIPWGQGGAVFLINEKEVYRESGGNGRGRGFNVAVINSENGRLEGQPLNFDTWRSSLFLGIGSVQGEAHTNLVNHLTSIPKGKIVMITVGDEAGLNYWPVANQLTNCEFNRESWSQNVLKTLQGLGSTNILNYCYNDSWAMIIRQGESVPLEEQLGKGEIPAVVSYSFPFSTKVKRPVISLKPHPFPWSLTTVIKVEAEPDRETTIQSSQDLLTWEDRYIFVSTNGVAETEFYTFFPPKDVPLIEFYKAIMKERKTFR